MIDIGSGRATFPSLVRRRAAKRRVVLFKDTKPRSAAIAPNCGGCSQIASYRQRELRQGNCAFTTFRFGGNRSYFQKERKPRLEWTEAVTLLSAEGVPDDVYDRVRSRFSEPEISELTFA